MLACALVAPATASARDAAHAPPTAHLSQAAAASNADPAADPLLAHFLDVARAYWGAAPKCPAGISLQRAQWLPDPGVWAAAMQGGCAMAFDPDYYPAPAGYDVGWWQAAMCSVVAHEWGHLLGYGHVADPNKLMNPVTPLNLVAGCPTWGVSAAAPAPSAPAPAPSRATRPAAQKKRTAAKRTCAAKARRGSKRTRRRCPARAKRRSARR